MPTVQRKEGGRNPHQKREVRHDKVLMSAGTYEVSDDSVFTVKVPLRQSDDENEWWVLTNEDEAEVIEEVVFRMWTYDEMVDMRKMSTQYDQLRRVHMIDHDSMNRLKMQRLLKAWTFGKNNPRLQIHHVGGVMTDESWDAVKHLQPNILRYLIEQMNERYEFGG